jgi:hypothetical protein
VENPEVEFLQWLLMRYIKDSGIDENKATLKDLMESIKETLTPIGGG